MRKVNILQLHSTLSRPRVVNFPSVNRRKKYAANASSSLSLFFTGSSVIGNEATRETACKISSIESVGPSRRNRWTYLSCLLWFNQNKRYALVESAPTRCLGMASNRIGKRQGVKGEMQQSIVRESIKFVSNNGAGRQDICNCGMLCTS
jgi:hypothetical protein